jgi:hypothetical protein
MSKPSLTASALGSASASAVGWDPVTFDLGSASTADELCPCLQQLGSVSLFVAALATAVIPPSPGPQGLGSGCGGRAASPFACLLLLHRTPAASDVSKPCLPA